MKWYLALIVLAPLAGGICNAFCGRWLPRRLVATIACGAIWLSFAGALLACRSFAGGQRYEYASWLADFDFSAPLALYLDQLSLTLTLMITFVCGLIHLYSTGYMKDDPAPARYFALLNIFVFAMLTLVLAENRPLLYLGWEGVGFCSYALIGFWYQEPRNATAGRKAFIVTRIGDTALAIAMIWMYQLFSTESISELNGMGFLMPGGIITALGILLLIGAAGKSAQLPLSVWLPDAMAGPTPVSAQIHAATMVTAGVYLLARLFPLIGSSTIACAAIAATGAATALYAATCACRQRDVKRILAYSTISQIGYMILGVGSGALTASVFHLLTHAFFKALLFLGAGCLITALHHQQDIFRMGGLRKRLAPVYWPFLAGSLCLAGFPGSSGFFSKDAILATLFDKGGFYGLLFAVGILTALLTSFYTFRMFFIIFHGAASDHDAVTPRPLPSSMTTTLLPLAAGALAGGLLNLPSYLTSGFLSTLLAPLPGFGQPHHGDAGQEVILQLGAAAVSLAGLALAWWRYTGSRRAASLSREQAPGTVADFLLNGWYLDRLYAVLFVSPFVRASRFLWKKVDDGGIDGSINGLGRFITAMGQVPARWSNGRVATSLTAVVGGVAAILLYVVWLSR